MGVGFCVYYMHRRKDIYAEDAMEFPPEKWVGPELANIGCDTCRFMGARGFA